MKNLIKISFVILIIASCGSKKNEDPKNIAEDHNNAKFNDLHKQKEAKLIVDAAEFDLQQICLSKLAQQNSIDTKTQQAGKTLEKEYTTLYSFTKDLGTKKQITVPKEMSIPKENICKALSYEIAEDFDNKFYELVIKDHSNAIRNYERSVEELNDPEMISFMKKQLGDLKKNLVFILLNYRPTKKQAF